MGTVQDTIHVLCVDDSSDITAVMRMIVESEAGMQCVGCRASADDLVEEVRGIHPHPDVVVLDANMPGKNPLEAMSELQQAFPEIKTIIYSGHNDQAFRERMMNAGAWGCVSKNDPPATILQAVREVAAGGTFFPGSPRLQVA